MVVHELLMSANLRVPSLRGTASWSTSMLITSKHLQANHLRSVKTYELIEVTIVS